MNQWTEDNVVQRQIINERVHSDHTGGNIIRRQSWSKWSLEAIESKDIPEGHFHIVILWNMAIDRWGYTNEYNWMGKRCTPPRLTVGPSILKPKDALHHMSMGDKSNIIDEAETFIFTIWLNELRRSIKKNTKHTTMSLLLQVVRCISRRLDSFQED
jgi:hypothetical protein